MLNRRFETTTLSNLKLPEQICSAEEHLINRVEKLLNNAHSLLKVTSSIALTIHKNSDSEIYVSLAVPGSFYVFNIERNTQQISFDLESESVRNNEQERNKKLANINKLLANNELLSN